MFSWNAQKLRFRRDAAEYLGFDGAIAERILSLAGDVSHMCDAGCGAGFTAAAFAKRCARVTAVDTSREALDMLRETAARRGLANIEAVEADLFAMEPAEKYDAMTFCFFGKTEETLRAAAAQCSGRVFLVRKAWDTRRFTAPGAPLSHSNFAAVLRELDAFGVRYETDTLTLDTGQPFASLADAALFFEEYGGAGSAAGLNVASLLEPTGRADFPYLLSELRPVGIIMIETGKIPAAIL